MRAIRLVIAALIALALAALPVSASVAKPHGTAPEMSMSAPDHCSSGDTTHDRGEDVCQLKCCSTVAVLSRELPLAAPHGETVVDTPAASLSPFQPEPDPPPPRV